MLSTLGCVSFWYKIYLRSFRTIFGPAMVFVKLNLYSVFSINKIKQISELHYRKFKNRRLLLFNENVNMLCCKYVVFNFPSIPSSQILKIYRYTSALLFHICSILLFLPYQASVLLCCETTIIKWTACIIQKQFIIIFRKIKL